VSETNDKKRTVTVGLRGRLGNQLFQYAVGRCVAETQDRTLIVDDLALQRVPPDRPKRTYYLGAFDPDVRLTSCNQPPNLALWVRVMQFGRGFHGEILEPSPFPHIYLEGFWQDERYFKAIEPTIRRRLTPTGQEWREEAHARSILSSRCPIAVHVRRQDYLEAGGAHIGFVGESYYSHAIRTMLDRVESPHFFVFSDDVDWCEETFEFEHPHSFVRHDGVTQDHTITDFRLMSLCRHFVVANSSFSWWAAWLGAASDKIVIAPKRWFRDREDDSRDITPLSWMRL
jgi:hypothetical protein